MMYRTTYCTSIYLSIFLRPKKKVPRCYYNITIFIIHIHNSQFDSHLIRASTVDVKNVDDLCTHTHARTRARETLQKEKSPLFRARTLNPLEHINSNLSILREILHWKRGKSKWEPRAIDSFNASTVLRPCFKSTASWPTKCTSKVNSCTNKQTKTQRSGKGARHNGDRGEEGLLVCEVRSTNRNTAQRGTYRMTKHKLRDSLDDLEDTFDALHFSQDQNITLSPRHQPTGIFDILL